MKKMKYLALIVILLIGVRTEVYATGICTNGVHKGSAQVSSSTSATCTRSGKTYYKCSMCGGSMGSSTTAALGHSYSLRSHIAPSCTSQGAAGYSCGRCGDSYTVLADPLGHNWGSWSVSSYPTCTTDGKDVRSCSRCSASDSRTKTKYGHNWQSAGIVTYVSCTTDEVTGYECFRCGAGKTEVTRSRLGHNYVMTQGNTEQHWKDCSRCSSTTSYGGHYDDTYDGYCDVCGREWYLAPSVPTITVKDTAGSVIPATTTWTNKDMSITVGGSTLKAGLGGVGYQYKMNSNSYATYSSAISYTSIKTDTTFYARSYNTGRTSMKSAEVSRVLPKIERDKPTFSISVDSQEYEKSHTATLTFADSGGSKLKATDYIVSYTWTTSTSTPSSYSNSMTVSVAATNQTTATITKSDGTGLYYLHVKLNKKITDNATNECATTTLYIPFYMDNTAPVITQKSIESNPVALNSKATYNMGLLVKEEHSGLVTTDFVASDIIVKVNGKESTATKTLTYKSVSNNIYEYNLTLTNITETGPITLTIKNESVPDYATNKCVETLFTLTRKSGNNFIGPYGDNVIPTISMTGEVTSVTVPANRNLSGVVDKRYVNQYYTVKIPFRILDVGGQDFTNVLEEKDFAVYSGTTVVTPSQIVVTLNSTNTTADTQTNLSIYQKDYTLTLTGLTADGFIELVNAAGSITDLATNVNVQTKSAPYTIISGNRIGVFVDNTKPQPTIKQALTNKVGSTISTSIEIFVRELGSGLLGNQVEQKDMGVKINGNLVNATSKLTPNAANNYTTALGKDSATNYTYTLQVENIKETGTLRIQVKENQIIDKANNGNEAVSLDMPKKAALIDNKGPLLGPITINKDANGEIYGDVIEVKITDCRDESGIAKYEWQRSEDGTNFNTIYTEDSTLSESFLEDSVTVDKTYYYRVIVSDLWGNTSTSEVVSVVFKSKMDAKPTLNLTKEQIDDTKIVINGIIKSKNKIVKIEVNDREIPKSYYENNVKENQYEITTTFTWPVTQNGIYKFTATDEKGNTVTGTINVNEFDFSAAVITPSKKDATLLTPAQIVFTSNEPVRIIDKNAHPGITYDTTDFSTKIIATVSPDVDFDDMKIFEFENKGLTQVPVEVNPPLITKFAYLRFASPTTGDLDMNVLQIESLTKGARSAKVLTASGQVKSYYGFKNESVDTRISTEADINAAIKLGGASEAYVMNEAGELVKLEKTVDSNVSANSNYATGNASGMYNKTSGLFDNYSDRLLNDETIKYSKFRMTMVP